MNLTILYDNYSFFSWRWEIMGGNSEGGGGGEGFLL